MEEFEPKSLEADLHGPSWNERKVLVALAVMFAIHVGLCWWLSYNEQSWLRYPQYKTVRNVADLARKLEKYRKTNGCFPDCLEELCDEEVKYTLSDGWKRPLNYITDGKTWRISSNGSDGQPGGVGIETDLWFDDALFPMGENIQGTYKTTPPTIKQIFVKKFFHDVLFNCVMLVPYFSVPTFVYWLDSRKPRTRPHWSFGVWLGFLMGLNTMIAVISMISAAKM